MRGIIALLLVLLGFAAGYGVFFFFKSESNIKKEENTEILLERIKQVSKLITVEGYFTEIYNYKDYWKYDWWPFQRKALIRVKAKVSVGYDMSKIKIDSNPATKTITISNIPQPEILSIDHDLDYYDVSEGTFNTFEPSDYNRLNENAKKFILDKAGKSDLLQSAKAQGVKTFDMIRFVTEVSGWSLTIDSTAQKKILQ